MNRKLWIGLIVGLCLCGTWLSRTPATSVAEAQKPRDEAQWEYKVELASYNPGERMTDKQRASAYEKALNEQAREGWEPVTSILSRDMVQTIGGAVTTRDTTSFFVYRRPKR